MNEQYQFTINIPEESTNQRLDRVLAQLLPQYSRSQLQVWLKNGHIRMNGATLIPRYKVSGGETVVIQPLLSVRAEHTQKACEMPLAVVYEDEHLMVINKPPGLVVHPGAGNWEGTLLNGLLHHAPSLETLPRAGIIHRLDKDTSGLLIVAKTLPARQHLVLAMQNREISRHYTALVCGELIAGGTVDAPIARDQQRRTQMQIHPQGKPAVTHYRVQERFRLHTRLKLILESGRTHQIRVHMRSIHHAIVGDRTYGYRPHLPRGADDALRTTLQKFCRQALHAAQLKFSHPITGTELDLKATLPDDLQRLLHLLQEDKQHHMEQQ